MWSKQKVWFEIRQKNLLKHFSVLQLRSDQFYLHQLTQGANSSGFQGNRSPAPPLSCIFSP